MSLTSNYDEGDPRGGRDDQHHRLRRCSSGGEPSGGEQCASEQRGSEQRDDEQRGGNPGGYGFDLRAGEERQLCVRADRPRVGWTAERRAVGFELRRFDRR